MLLFVSTFCCLKHSLPVHNIKDHFDQEDFQIGIFSNDVYEFQTCFFKPILRFSKNKAQLSRSSPPLPFLYLTITLFASKSWTLRMQTSESSSTLLYPSYLISQQFPPMFLLKIFIITCIYPYISIPIDRHSKTRTLLVSLDSWSMYSLHSSMFTVHFYQSNYLNEQPLSCCLFPK